MSFMFAFFALATAALYVFYSRKVGSFVNAITIYTGLKFAIEFVLEPISYYLRMFVYDFNSMAIINLLSFVGYAAFVVGLLVIKQPNNPARKINLSGYLGAAWIVLVLAWVLYMPILREFSYLITEPRRIYELTRTGYGLNTFGSSLLSFVAYAIFLMSSKKNGWLFYLALFPLVYLKGTKGQFFVLASIFVIYKVYFEGFKYSVTRSAIYIIAFAGMATVLFTVNYRGEVENIVLTMAGYSDYNRNGALIVQDKSFAPYGGQLSTEMLWIPKIPRAIWPNKPKSFGEFRLAEQYFPSWFALDQGAPAFGIGLYFADFGWFSFAVVPFVQFLCGIGLAYCLNKMIESPTIFWFIMSIYLSGGNLFAAGSGNYLLEHALIGAALTAIFSFFGLGRRSDGDRVLGPVQDDALVTPR
ncbi:hypothetical protein [Sphingomonas adhaesiva]|uniref:hypothetical protein n=1 Tax=Sphingomonas adhaesiva TaxID=28212 RepID=UPI001141AC45|nr:hypothetical protein [Sphingomonas adhaesiva]